MQSAAGWWSLFAILLVLYWWYLVWWWQTSQTLVEPSPVRESLPKTPLSVPGVVDSIWNTTCFLPVEVLMLLMSFLIFGVAPFVCHVAQVFFSPQLPYLVPRVRLEWRSGP